MNLFKKIFYGVYSRFYCTNVKYVETELNNYGKILNSNFKPLFTPGHTNPKIKLKNFNINAFSLLINNSIQLIYNSLADYGFRNVYVSFNGGKDSLVALHIYRLASHKYSPHTQPHELQVVYFKDPNFKEFTEITQFIHYITKQLHINMTMVESGWNEGVKSFRNENLCFILGTRRVDEGCSSLSEIEPGNSDEFKFLRINPLLNWSYHDIWNFLLFFQLDYCTLYNQGYTSIGSRDDTVCNEYLRIGDGYLPAYELVDEQYERCSRLK
ncbi:Phosphoadenosine phosphosulfate reductase family protein [Theileria parva strain Muguga]|uniref:Phosphoadenosine phosphosulfate reductase family protein n=1 Tax=Theileria parva strain Muguga TaxID=333668 RepID=UPI001C617E7B|nr:Phosphoadenosine phosphosulfate reductase family protein [Theileria parva strain Muguga]EAN30823.2 Phosphoadenosine phosphosulfate reductase family protein [Theileria parva strain Muguga]